MQVVGATAAQARVARDVDGADARLEGAQLALRTARHELGNVLTPARAYSQMLAARDDLPPDVRRMLARVVESVERGAALIDRFGELERIVERPWPGRPSTIDLDASLSDDRAFWGLTQA